MPRRAVLLSFVLAGTPVTAPAAPVPSPATVGEARRQIDALRGTLESAVSRAAGPGRLSPRVAGGGVYHLPGYGAMLVLSPRALPTRSVIVLRPERSVTPEMEAAMTIDLGELERELQAQMAAQARAMRELERHQRDRVLAQQDVRREIEAIEQQVELMREEADRVRAMAEREVLVHLGMMEAPEAPPAAATPLPPAAPHPPAAAVSPPPAVPAALASPPGLQELPQPREPRQAPLAELPPPPPWRFWFETRDGGEARRPAVVVAAVRDALAAGLGSHRGSLSALRDEWVTVAVDFVPQLAGRPTRTLQARVRVKDLQARRAGTLAADAFLTRIEFEEY
jgi:hypothetical protein